MVCGLLVLFLHMPSQQKNLKRAIPDLTWCCQQHTQWRHALKSDDANGFNCRPGKTLAATASIYDFLICFDFGRNWRKTRYSANDVQLLDMRRPIDGYFESWRRLLGITNICNSFNRTERTWGSWVGTEVWWRLAAGRFRRFWLRCLLLKILLCCWVLLFWKRTLDTADTLQRQTIGKKDVSYS